MHYAVTRFVCFLALILALSASLTAQVFAADLNVRTGAHEQYSRLVFDWTATVEYTIDRSDKSRLIIEFSAAATLNAKAAKSNPVANISALESLSSDPLKVAISIPKDSRVRDLKAGNKVIIDVYHPPGGAQKQEKLAVKKSEPEAAKKPAEKTQSPETAEIIEATEAKTPDVPLEEAPKLRKLTMREEPTLVTVSSTQNFGMAVFELGGRLWMVNDKSNLLIKPQLSGPLAEQLSPITDVKGLQGKAHTLLLPEGQTTKGNGGGILWRVLVGRGLELDEAPEPKRVEVNRADARSGKILWPLKGARAVLDFKDPVSGHDIKVVTVEEAKQYAGPPREFIDFEVLYSPVGLAIIPKVSDLNMQIVRGGVEISRPGGLTMVEESLLASMTAKKIQAEDDDTLVMTRVFDFKAWQLGGIPSLLENKRIILAGLKELPETAQAESLLTLGKMYLSNSMGPEALGVLDFAAQERPGLFGNPEFTALHGAASALSSHNIDAFSYLSQDILIPFEEVHYWRAYILADEGDWQQAAEILPKKFAPLYDYPVLLQNRLLPRLAEIALRSGDLKSAEELLAIIEKNKKEMQDPQKASLVYLQGELFRQQKNTKKTKKLWKPLTVGSDDLYRAKAGLSLARLKVAEGEITPEEAIDDLERLRYAWRGDQLEVQINYWLGRTYFEAGKYLKGLKLMRDAVSYDEGTPLGQRVAGEMADIYAQLFLGEELDKVSPLDAIGLYDEFKELVPLDERGDKIIERLAEHLAKADLLTRAGDLLQYQLDHRLKDADIYRVGVRVAAIRLLDAQYDKAIKALNVAAAKLQQLPEEMRTTRRYRDISLLRARALSRKGRPDQALALLGDLDRTADMNRLRADIAWTAGYWDDAAEALGDVLLDQNISLTRPLDEEDTALLLQRAVSLNLAGDRIGLANMREKYSDLMAQTEKSKVFDVITRPRQSGALADRDTLLSVVSEVDLFKDFLDSYKNAAPPVN